MNSQQRIEHNIRLLAVKLPRLSFSSVFTHFKTTCEYKCKPLLEKRLAGHDYSKQDEFFTTVLRQTGDVIEQIIQDPNKSNRMTTIQALKRYADELEKNRGNRKHF